MAVSDAELDDIQRDAESTAKLVGAPGSPVRLRASATARLVAEVRRLRSLVAELGEGHDRLCSRSDPAYQHVRCTCDYDVRQALRAAGDDS